jgi:hypothetical protein
VVGRVPGPVWALCRTEKPPAPAKGQIPIPQLSCPYYMYAHWKNLTHINFNIPISSTPQTAMKSICRYVFYKRQEVLRELQKINHLYTVKSGSSMYFIEDIKLWLKVNLSL